MSEPVDCRKKMDMRILVSMRDLSFGHTGETVHFYIISTLHPHAPYRIVKTFRIAIKRQ